MEDKCFFDTNVMIYDFLADDKIETYNTDNMDIKPALSLFVKEEFLHKAATQQIYKKQYSTPFENFNELWEKFEYYTANYLIARLSFSKLDRKFNNILNNLLIDLGKDFEEEYGSKIPGGKDIIHIATADAFECKKLITSDSQFLGLEDLDIELQNLEKIIYIDNDTLNIEETVPVG